MSAPTRPVAGLDLGGTNLRVAVADVSGSPGAESAGRVSRSAAPRSLEELDDVLARLASRQPGAVAFAIPGLVEATRCRWVPNLPFLDGVDLGELTRRHLGRVPVVVANDAHLALVAEARWGAARRATDAVLLAIGTGIGSAVLADGRIVRGAHGAACSFGWACADRADPGDRDHGWLERHAAGSALDRAAALIAPGPDGSRVAGGGPALVDAARHGQPDARMAVHRLAEALGTALAGAVALLAPECVVVSGGVAEALDVLEPPLRVALHRHLPAHLHGVPVVAAEFGGGASLLGALLAGRDPDDWWEVHR